MADDVDLVRDLASAHDGQQGLLGVVHDAAEGLELLLHEEAGHGAARGHEGHHAAHGGVGAVGGAEGVVHVGVREAGQGLGELLLVLRLALVEAQVLQQQHLARLQGGGLGLHLLAGHAGGQRHVQAQALQVRGHGGHAELGLETFALGSAQVGAEDDGGAAVQQVAEGGEGLGDAGRVLDDAFLEGHVQVRAQEDPVAFHINVPEGSKRHG
ncbi:MAG TPA: hypothetical protein VK188_14275 [Holophaga sp.]|nr:hypothetical protein [Holophaga sp.]